jgi:DNA-binding transcriptional ArsR family regulator
MAECQGMAHRDSRPRVDAYESVFAALAHAARRRVLLTIYFNGGSMTAGEIASIFEHAWQTTTRHLQVLEAAGLLTHQKQGRRRIYRIQPKRLELVRDWLAHFSRIRKALRRNHHGSETTR